MFAWPEGLNTFLGAELLPTLKFSKNPETREFLQSKNFARCAKKTQQEKHFLNRPNLVKKAFLGCATNRMKQFGLSSVTQVCSIRPRIEGEALKHHEIEKGEGKPTALKFFLKCFTLDLKK